MDKKEKKIIAMARPIVNRNILRAASHVILSGKWTQGRQVEDLESMFNQLTDASYSVAVSSGTAALHTLLQYYSFKKDDEIITTPFTFIATLNAIILAGAKPVFADISESDFNLNPEEVEKKITKRTKAILAVDLYGQPANYKALKNIARKYNLYLFGDCAQSIAAMHHEKSPSSYADGVIYSLYATKNISSAEGGVIVTNSSKLAGFARSFRHQGQVYGAKPYTYTMVGLNYRLSEIHAVLALEQMKLLNAITEKRRSIAGYYNRHLANIHALILPVALPQNKHVYHQYTVRLSKNAGLNRDTLREKLLEMGIQTGVYYPIPLHLVSHAAFLGYKKGDLPIAEKISREVISLPIHTYLTQKAQKHIITSVKKFIS